MSLTSSTPLTGGGVISGAASTSTSTNAPHTDGGGTHVDVVYTFTDVPGYTYTAPTVSYPAAPTVRSFTYSVSETLIGNAATVYQQTDTSAKTWIFTAGSCDVVNGVLTKRFSFRNEYVVNGTVEVTKTYIVPDGTSLAMLPTVNIGIDQTIGSTVNNVRTWLLDPDDSSTYDTYTPGSVIAGWAEHKFTRTLELPNLDNKLQSIVYTATEAAAPGYNAPVIDGLNVTNRANVNVIVKKEWLGVPQADVPSDLVVTLTSDTTPQVIGVIGGTGNPNQWDKTNLLEWTFSLSLPMYDGTTPITYTVSEANPVAYADISTSHVVAWQTTGSVITGGNATLTNQYITFPLTIEKTWQGTPPTWGTITFYIERSDGEVMAVPMTPSWSPITIDVPAYYWDGTQYVPYTYIVYEDNPPGFTQVSVTP
ncbi:hypothetical protein AGMMS49992_33300 [Clostridia bacterium]|nr:hypothetical protein AGMMS49992_33300 [Clostridia bacterium]